MARRADPVGLAGSSACSRSRPPRSTPSTRAPSACSARWPRRWAPPSRTRACSTRPSGCWPTPTSGPPSWRSSTRSARPCRGSSSSTRSSSSSASGFGRCSTRRSIFIALHDPVTNLITFPYDLDEGEPFHRDPRPLGPGLTSTVITTGRPLRLGTNEESDAAGAIQVGGTDTQSWLGAPITGANRVIGVIGLESLEADAYTEADERLIATLASSMGVALENARLFDETKRLLTDTDERAAELAIINDVQQGLAAQIEMQAMYELVGERLRDLFDAQVLDIGIYDRDEGLIHFPYTIERGVRFPDEPIPLMGIRKHVIETREPLLINERAMERAIEFGQAGGAPGRGPEVDRMGAAHRRRRGHRRRLPAEPRPRERLHRVRPAGPDDAPRQPEPVPRERAADPRDAPAGDRARDHQRDRAGAGEPARPRSDVRARRQPDAGHVRGRPRLRRHARRRGRSHRVRVLQRERRATGSRGPGVRRGPARRRSCAAASRCC